MIAPEKIYLQESDFDSELTTWCEDPVNDSDVEYIRKDVAEKQLADLKAKHNFQIEQFKHALNNLIIWEQATEDGYLMTNFKRIFGTETEVKDGN